MRTTFNKFIIDLDCQHYRITGSPKRWYAEEVECTVTIEQGYKGLSRDDLHELAAAIEQLVNEHLAVLHVNQVSGRAEDGELILNSVTKNVMATLKTTVEKE